LLASGEEALVVGDGARRYPDVLADVARCEPGGPANAYPSAAALVELAHPRAVREDFCPPWELEPLYLRKTDAEINWERRVAG
jgi:tRNA threonylcarbamoyladenosine biosynthesis protein TsaB